MARRGSRFVPFPFMDRLLEGTNLCCPFQRCDVSIPYKRWAGTPHDSPICGCKPLGSAPVIDHWLWFKLSDDSLISCCACKAFLRGSFLQVNIISYIADLLILDLLHKRTRMLWLQCCVGHGLCCTCDGDAEGMNHCMGCDALTHFTRVDTCDEYRFLGDFKTRCLNPGCGSIVYYYDRNEHASTCPFDPSRMWLSRLEAGH